MSSFQGVKTRSTCIDSPRSVRGAKAGSRKSVGTRRSRSVAPACYSLTSLYFSRVRLHWRLASGSFAISARMLLAEDSRRVEARGSLFVRIEAGPFVIDSDPDIGPSTVVTFSRQHLRHPQGESGIWTGFRSSMAIRPLTQLTSIRCMAVRVPLPDTVS
jgi:hypothetical protein